MKIAITSTGDNFTSKFDDRFGRSSWFCLYDNENGNIQFIENSNKNLSGGAGTKTAEMIAELGVKQVISGDFGPKAKSLLEQLRIQMIILEERDQTIQELLNRLKH
ncbi:MAG TPA: dinitrogenase iron-molybdenum cofactor biosynthesis protein [Prolixibacteraceae bacterium]|nr:dinitrogenase iron-molybdenum cofactor biosynthesis protein [Prolixibacteraceae bacterium]